MKIFCLFLALITVTLVKAQHINRFMVVGDAHHYSPSPDFTQTILYEITRAAIDEQVNFIFFTGDLIVKGFGSPAEEDSVLKDWRFVLDTLSHHNINVFACRGNNDVSSREAWDSLFSGRYILPQNGPENEKNITYAIEYDNLLFIALDEYTVYHQINQGWLDELLATSNSEHIFAAGHEPAFKIFPLSCLSEYPEERNSFWESLTNAGAKAYFCGHNHFFDHAIIDDGDGNPLNDIHQVIIGTGGGSLFTDSEYNGDNGHWMPVRLFHEENYGYVLVEINDYEIQMKWKHREGPHIYEDGGDSYDFSSAGTGMKGLSLIEPFILNGLNPFHNTTIITYHLPVTGIVDLDVYDLTGRKVTTLTEENQQSGIHEIEWNTEGVKPGIYFCKLKVNNFERTVKLIINY